jgi:hypothetical protein
MLSSTRVAVDDAAEMYDAFLKVCLKDTKCVVIVTSSESHHRSAALELLGNPLAASFVACLNRERFNTSPFFEQRFPIYTVTLHQLWFDFITRRSNATSDAYTAEHCGQARHRRHYPAVVKNAAASTSRSCMFCGS